MDLGCTIVLINLKLVSSIFSHLHGDYPVGEEQASEVPVDDQDVEDDVDEVEAVAEDQLDGPPGLVVVHVPEEVSHVAVHVLHVDEGRHSMWKELQECIVCILHYFSV